jgi:hypothetical protein
MSLVSIGSGVDGHLPWNDKTVYCLLNVRMWQHAALVLKLLCLDLSHIDSFAKTATEIIIVVSPVPSMGGVEWSGALLHGLHGVAVKGVPK